MGRVLGPGGHQLVRAENQKNNYSQFSLVGLVYIESQQFNLELLV